MGRGQAFRWDGGRRSGDLPVRKTWRQLDGRDFLIEEVPVPDIADELDRLPPSTGALPPGTNAVPRTASLRLDLPPAPRTARADHADAPPMLLARVTPPDRAFVLDYQGNIGTNNYTFQADTTYYVSGRLDLYGTTTFEGGAVIKYTNRMGADLWVHGPMLWDTGPYRPVVFTARDDDSVGETLPGSTGNPQRQDHVALVTAQAGTVRGARFLYARTALCPAGASLTAEDVQFVDCGNAIDAYGQPVTVRNGLFSRVTTLVAGNIANLTLTGEHWTADAFSNLVAASSSVSAVNLTNCLFTAGTHWVTGQASPTIHTNAVTWLGSAGGVYQTAGAGRYYLADASPYRNTGVTNLTLTARALIEPRTTYPPIVLSNTTLTVDTTFTPQAARDTDTPDLGYHYTPLDYLCSEFHVTNALLRLAPGAAMGYGRGHGILILGEGRLSAEGTALQPVTFAAVPGVQEQPVRWPAGSGSPAYPLMAYRYGTPGGEGRLRFARFFAAGLPPTATALYQVTEWTFNPLDVRDSQFHHMTVQLDQSATNHVARARLVNNLFVRCGVQASFQGEDQQGVDFQANTLHRSSLEVMLEVAPADRWRVRDNLFHETPVYFYGVEHSHNAYATNAYAGTNTFTDPPRTTNDLQLASFAFVTGPLGHYYLPTNSPQIDAGSLSNAALAGLYHHTTQTNQTKEATTRLDLGFHYVACDANGNPADTDSDGIPDYRDADSDGDTLPDAWEIEHFGGLSQTAGGDYDGDGATNREEYDASTDPNTLSLMTQFETLYTTNRTVAGTCLVFGGVPASMAVLVNDTNLATAAWAPFAAGFTASLPNTDGVHTVVLAVRGLSPNITAAMDATDITLDRVPPVLCLTNPATATVTVIKPYLQLQGWANEPLASLAYDLTNAADSVTNEPAYVVDQYFDTNQFDFTTNYFQAYDLELTNGANAITLRVSDLAGNVTVTNFSVTLSYASATNPPVLGLIWPTNGAALSGDTFFLRGRINDETARLWAESVVGGVTNEFPGLVERDGIFWVENLPLAAGTNWFSVKALDAAGNLNSTNLAVVKSSVSLAITSTPQGDALYTPFGTVSGTVTATNPAYTVTVNGVAASVDAYGNWTATSVPVLGKGTATFTAVATGAGSVPPVSVAAEQEMPAHIEIVKHEAKKSQSEYYNGGYSVTRQRVKKYRGGLHPSPSGEWVKDFLGEVDDSYTDSNTWYQNHYEWTATNVSTHWNTPSGSGGSATLSDPEGTIRCLPEQDVRYPAPGGTQVYYLAHYYARSVKHDWPYSDGSKAAAGVDARTKMNLYTGGKSGIKRKSLIHITGSAEQYGRPPGGVWPTGFPWWDTPVTNIPATKIQVMGWWFFGRHLDPSGDLYVVLPDNAVKDLNLRVSGVKHYGARATVEKIRLDLNSVEFTGGLAVLSDFATNYPTPHWQTNEATHGVISSPVLYVSGSNVQTTTVFTNHALSSSGVGGDFPLIIKGVVSGGHTSFKLWGTNLYWVGASCSVDMVADHPLTASKVDFFQPMTIKWYYGYTNKPDFLYAGRSTNQVYVSWKAPTAANLYHTVVDVACRNAVAKTTEAEIVSGICSDFSGPIPGVKRADGIQMVYYQNSAQPYQTPLNFPGLLATGTGRCGTFADLLSQSLAVHDIVSTVVGVVPDATINYVPQAVADYTTLHGHNPATDAYYIVRNIFFVKSWNLDSLTTNRWGAVDLSGVPGQGNANPVAIFGDHALVLHAGNYYDPSYGTGPFNSLLEWEDSSIDGYGVQFIKDPDAYSADFIFWIGKKDTKGNQEVQ